MAPPPLYKYLDVRGAKLTLGNRTFKHAKPSDFNDTEDVTIQSIFAEDVEAALAKVDDCFTDVILEHLNDPPTCGERLREKVALIQRVYREKPTAANLVRAEKGKVPANIDVEQARARSQAFVDEINEFMQGYRILCATTELYSERMWTEYAQNHEGIALRINPSIGKDSKFRLFRPVEYKESRPPLYDDTRDFVAGSLFGDQENRRRAAMDKIIYTKTRVCEHEREYRLAIPLRQGEDWNTLPFHPEEITELYLGLSMTNENRDEILDKARAINPRMSIFQACRGANQALAFQTNPV